MYAVLAATTTLARLDAIFATHRAQAAYYHRLCRLGFYCALRNHPSYGEWTFKGY